MGNEISGPGQKPDPAPLPAADEAPRDPPPASQEKQTESPDAVETRPPQPETPADTRSEFLASLRPSRLFGRKQDPRETPEKRETFLSGLMESVRSGTRKLAQVNDFLSNPYVQDGLEVLRESGLNGLVLGAQVKRDIESGKIPPDMVARLKSSTFRTGDIAFLLGYVRDLAGGTLELNLDNDAARRLISKVNFPPEVKPETIRGLQLGPGDKMILRFSGDPLYDAGAVSFDFNKELELSISGIGDANATNLTFEAEGGTATEMMFSGWNLEATDNKAVDGVLSFLVKILLAPFLLIASLFGEARGARVSLEDEEDGSTRLRAEALGATVADEQITNPTEEEPADE